MEDNYYVPEHLPAPTTFLLAQRDQQQSSSPRWALVEEELEETLYWIELLIESGHLSSDQAKDLIREAKELLAITVASIKTAKRKK